MILLSNVLVMLRGAILGFDAACLFLWVVLDTLLAMNAGRMTAILTFRRLSLGWTVANSFAIVRPVVMQGGCLSIGVNLAIELTSIICLWVPCRLGSVVRAMDIVLKRAMLTIPWRMATLRLANDLTVERLVSRTSRLTWCPLLMMFVMMSVIRLLLARL